MVDANGSGLPFRVSNVSIKISKPEGLEWDETHNYFHDFFSAVRGPFDDTSMTYGVNNNIIDITVNSFDPAVDFSVMRFDPADTPPVNSNGWIMFITALEDCTYGGRISNLGRTTTCFPEIKGKQLLGYVYSSDTTLGDLQISKSDIMGHGKWLVEIYPITSLPSP